MESMPMEQPPLNPASAIDDKPGAYAFDAEERIVRFPVDWPGAVNRSDVTVCQERTDFDPQQILIENVFGRDSLDQIAAYYDKSAIKARAADKGGGLEYLNASGDAEEWLWDVLIQRISGYPGLKGLAVGAQDPVLPVRKGPNGKAVINLPSSHKQKAIRGLFNMHFIILDDECQLSMTGGVWVGELRLGDKDAPYATIPMRFQQWDAEIERRFKVSRTTTRTGGKAAQQTTLLRPAAYGEVFDQCVEAIEGATVAGQTFAEHRNRPEYLRAISLMIKVTVVTALRERWESADRD